VEFVKDSEEISRHSFFLAMAEIEARKATCLERKCGAVLEKDGKIIGRGFNSPPGNLESQRRCGLDKSSLDQEITDKSCCVHAEERAIMDAPKDRRRGSVMYFTSVGDDGHRLFSGEPYCTKCSKSALDAGVASWVLEHEEGIVIYGAEEYNDLSFSYRS